MLDAPLGQQRVFQMVVQMVDPMDLMMVAKLDSLLGDKLVEQLVALKVVPSVSKLDEPLVVQKADQMVEHLDEKLAEKMAVQLDEMLGEILAVLLVVHLVDQLALKSDDQLAEQ